MSVTTRRGDEVEPEAVECAVGGEPEAVECARQAAR
jgi:hypothetical protein